MYCPQRSFRATWTTLTLVTLTTLPLMFAACGGSGASAASDGAAGSGGSGGSGGSAGATTTTPDAGDAAVAEVGTDAAATDATVVSGTVPADILKLCSFTNACSFGPVVSAPIVKCVETLVNDRLARGSSLPVLAAPRPASAQVIDRLLACAATAHTCAEFTSCGSLTFDCKAPLTPCHGNVAVVCKTVNDNVPDVTDCAPLGLVCVKGACVPATPGAACAFSVPGPEHCTGNSRVTCVYDSMNAGVEDARDCGAAATCTMVGASAVCLPNAAATCTTPGFRCDGTTLVGCAPLGTRMVELREDCAVAGRTCGPGPGGTQLGCQPTVGTACTANLNSATPNYGACDGNDIAACVDGKTVKITCADYGRTTCGMATTFPICL
jgi:hypothetical protein